MTEIIQTVGVVITRYENNEIEFLLVKHGLQSEHITGVYGLPAGRIQSLEKETDTAIRELFEETGLYASIANLHELPTQYASNIQRKKGTQRFSLKVYICTNYSGSLRSTDETEPEWITVSKLEELELLPNIKRVIHDSLAFIHLIKNENRIGLPNEGD